jgi:DNA (cytosine-5)-methyltransferase 1
MATSKKSIGTPLNDPTSSVAGIPVSLSVRQVNGEVKKIRVTCGRGFETPLADYDPDTQCWKMYGDISLWGDCPLLVNLPTSGMTRNGVLFPQPAWEPITDAIGSSSWPTPTVDDASNVNPKPNRFRGLVATVNQTMWPTPTFGKLAGGTGGMQQIEAQYLAGNINAEERRAMRAGNGGKLNPMWVEWLMGFPAGWTDLEDSETP